MKLNRIALVISSMGAGGAERVLSILANHWSRQGREVHLVTFRSDESDFYALDPNIRRLGLNQARISISIVDALGANAQRIITLRNALRRVDPDAVISFGDTTNIVAVAATRLTGMRLIVSERSNPTHEPAGRHWRLLRRIAYPWADMIVVQTTPVSEWASRIVGREKVCLIPNPVRSMPTRAEVEEPWVFKAAPGPRLVALGRLSPEKGFDLLIEAFALCCRRYPEWILFIFGEGPERTHLETQIRRLDLNDRVHLPGLTRGTESVLAHASLFVCPSRYEGFPNALAEAMAAGLPVVSFDCPNGPRELIKDRLNGLLVPPQDLNGLSAAMGSLMGSEPFRASLATRAREVSQRFSIASTLREWDKCVAAVSRRRGLQGT